MNTQRTVFSTGHGDRIPVTVDLNVKPLTFLSESIINGNGRKMMDDEWIYVNMPNYGDCSINVNRAQYCASIYKSKVSILDSIGFAKTTKRLDRFIELVSDKLIFKYEGIVYQVVLKKIGKVFDLDCVKPYWLVTHSPNLPIKVIPEKYKKVVNLPDPDLYGLAHDLTVNLKKAFNFSTNEN